MATSGYTEITQDIIIKLRFSWERTEYSATANLSTIKWTLTMTATGGVIQVGNDPSWTVTINDSEYTGTANIAMNDLGTATKTLASGMYVFAHNIDGTCSFNYSFSQDFQLSGVGKGSGTGTLDTIRVKALMKSAPSSFTDEENPTITFESPDAWLGRKVQVCIATSPSSGSSVAIIPYRDRQFTYEHTFELTDEERALLRKCVTSGSSVPVRFYARTEYNGTYEYSSLTSTLNLVNHTPTLSPVIEDTNARTIGLTGNKNTLIKYYSNAKVTFGAVARKEATIVDRRVICGSRTIEIEDRAQDVVTVNGVDSNTFYLRARDSRGNVIEQAPTKTLIPYVKLTNNIKSAKIVSTGTSSGTAKGQLTFTISGNYFNGSFGAKSNTLEVEYMLKDSAGNTVGGTESGWVKLGTVTPTIDGNNFSYTYTVNNLDYLETYTLTVNAIDELTPVQTSTTVVSAIPVFDWGKSDFKHHTNVYLDNNKTLRSYQTDGSDVQILGLNNSNGTVLGWGGYDKSNGDTGVYGNNVRIHTREKFLINGRAYGENKILWSHATGWYMNASQTITLNEAVSAQPNGIVLVFSLYRNGTSEDVSINSFFVSKKEVELLPGAPHSFLMAINAGFSNIGAKYLYISDTQITGHEGNTTSGTNSGITFNNSYYVLRYVIGV